jgi:hypothetical protein
MVAKKLPRRQAGKISAEYSGVRRQNLAVILGDSETKGAAKLHAAVFHN